MVGLRSSDCRGGVGNVGQSVAPVPGDADMTRSVNRAIADRRYEDAIRALTPLLMRYTTPAMLATIYANRGVAYVGLGRIRDAASDFDAALAQVDRAPQVYSAAGAMMFRAGDYAKARSYYERGLQKTANNDEVANN